MDWTRIDATNQTGSRQIVIDVPCFYYRPKVDGGYQASQANQDLFNFKKPMSRKGVSDWKYKGEAISKFSSDLARFVSDVSVIGSEVIVPMPTSKCNDDPMYDDRLVQVTQRAAMMTGLCAVDAFYVRKSVQPAHEGGSRNVAELVGNTVFDASMFDEEPPVIYLVDDTVTSGAHFEVCCKLIERVFPDTLTVGVFWAKAFTSGYSYGVVEF